MTDAQNRPLTVRETAKALGLSVHTVRAWISQRRLNHVRLGRAIRVLPDEIQRVLRNAAVPAIDPPHKIEDRR
jgi:excisionase family DNA binding protein